jgi:hypothetical protein
MVSSCAIRTSLTAHLAAAAQLSFSSPAKSVRFSDDLLEESSALLAKAKSTKHNPTPTKRNSPQVTLVQRATKARARKTDGGGAVSEVAIQVSKPKSPAKSRAKATKPPTANKADAGPRRSGRERTEIATYKNLASTRSAPVQPPAADKPTSPSTPRASRNAQLATEPSPAPSSSASSNQPWGAEEDEHLKSMREAGKSWDQINKAMPTRSLVALQARASKVGHIVASCGTTALT